MHNVTPSLPLCNENDQIQHIAELSLKPTLCADGGGLVLPEETAMGGVDNGVLVQVHCGANTSLLRREHDYTTIEMKCHLINMGLIL